MAGSAGTATGTWRLALVAASAESVVRLRAELVHDIIRQRHAVLCVTPPPKPAEARALRELGVQHRAVDLDPSGPRLLADWKATSALVDVFRDWQPHIVVGFGLRPMVGAAIAARRTGVRRVVGVVTGLPVDGLAGVGARRFAHAARNSDAIVFHNDDDRRRVESHIAFPPEVTRVVVAGAGVDLARHASRPLPMTGPGLTFLMIGRLERSRGVIEYASAARSLKERAPESRFLLAGQPGSGDGAVTPATLEPAGGVLAWLGALDDVRKTLADCHVFVYPSHREGMPRAVLEALATGRPVITTDAPGCRETVDDKVSGCLVPVGDAGALTAAMESFVRRPDLIAATAKAARTKAERRFDVREVNRVLLGTLGLR